MIELINKALICKWQIVSKIDILRPKREITSVFRLLIRFEVSKHQVLNHLHCDQVGNIVFVFTTLFVIAQSNNSLIKNCETSGVNSAKQAEQ